MIQFISEGKYVDDTEFPEIQMSLSGEAGLDSVINAFEDFLRATGYSFDGHLEIVNDSVPTNEVN